jgi:hypothetical protein
MIKPNLHIDGIRRLSHWEVIRSTGLHPYEWHCVLKKEALKSYLVPSTIWGHSKKLPSLKRMTIYQTLNLTMP